MSSPLTRTLTCSAVRLRLLPGTSIMNPAKSGFAPFTASISSLQVRPQIFNFAILFRSYSLIFYFPTILSAHYTSPIARACLKKAFCKMCVTICRRFCPDEDAVVGYGNRIRVKYTAKCDVHGISLITMDQLRQSLHLMPQVPLFCQGCALRSPRSGLHLLGFHIIYGYPPLS